MTESKEELLRPWLPRSKAQADRTGRGKEAARIWISAVGLKFCPAVRAPRADLQRSGAWASITALTVPWGCLGAPSPGLRRGLPPGGGGVGARAPASLPTYRPELSQVIKA